MIFDIVIGISIIIFAIKYYNEGLINSVILFFSKIITFISAHIVAKVYTQTITDKYVIDKLYGYIDSMIVKHFNFEEILNSLKTQVETTNSSAVEFILNAKGEEIEQILRASTDEAISTIRDTVVTSVAYGFTYLIIFIATVILVSIAFKIALAMINLVFELPILGHLNKYGGALLGIITALFISSIIIWTIMTVMPVSTMDNGMLNEQTIEGTYIIKHICNSYPSGLATVLY